MTQIPDAAAQALEALKKAEMFIENGVEYGFIHMPDKPDPALGTLPMIKAAIATLTNEGAKPVDVAAVNFNEIFSDLLSHVSAWKNGLCIAMLHAETKLPDIDDKSYWRHEINALNTIADAIRSISTEPAQGEQWQPIELVGDKERLIIIGSYNVKGEWCAEVWHTKYLRDQQEKSASGFFMNAPHLEWVPTHFMELPAAPTSEAEA